MSQQLALFPTAINAYDDRQQNTLQWEVFRGPGYVVEQIRDQLKTNPPYIYIDEEDCSSADLKIDRYATQDGRSFLEIDSRNYEDSRTLKLLLESSSLTELCEFVYQRLLRQDYVEQLKYYARFIEKREESVQQRLQRQCDLGPTQLKVIVNYRLGYTDIIQIDPTDQRPITFFKGPLFSHTIVDRGQQRSISQDWRPPLKSKKFFVYNYMGK